MVRLGGNNMRESEWKRAFLRLTLENSSEQMMAHIAPRSALGVERRRKVKKEAKVEWPHDETHQRDSSGPRSHSGPPLTVETGTDSAMLDPSLSCSTGAEMQSCLVWLFLQPSCRVCAHCTPHAGEGDTLTRGGKAGKFKHQTRRDTAKFRRLGIAVPL